MTTPIDASVPIIGSDRDRLVKAMRQMLHDGGALPSERTLAVRLDAKRHRVRAALDQMRRDGLLPMAGLPGGMAAARRIDAETLVATTNALEVIELRLILEPALARLAAVRASPFDIRRIERASSTAEDVAYGAADRAFHRAVASGARNALADGLYNLLRKVGADARIRFGDTRSGCPNRQRERDAEHRRIAEAIAARDPEAAAQAMHAHLLTVQQRVMRRLAPAATAA